MTTFLGVFLMLKMPTLLRKSNKIRKDHTPKTNMINRINRTGLNVLSMIRIQSTFNRAFKIIKCKHGLHVSRKVFNFQPFDLLVEILHCHLNYFRSEINNPNPRLWAFLSGGMRGVHAVQLTNHILYLYILYFNKIMHIRPFIFIFLLALCVCVFILLSLFEI